MSLRRRFTISIVAVLTAAVVLMEGAVYLVFRAQVMASVDLALDRVTGVIQGEVSGSTRTIAQIDQSIRANSSPTAPLAIVGYVSGTQQYSLNAAAQNARLSVPADVWHAAQSGNTDGAHHQVLTAGSGTSYDVDAVVISGSLRVGSGPSSIRTIAIAQPLAPSESTVNRVGILLVVAGMVTVLVGGVIAYVIGSAVTRPVSRLTSEVEDVGTDGDLDRRVGLPRRRDEIHRLAVAFNASLERIATTYRRLEKVLTAQRRFVADASHELRTPVTTVGSTLEMLHHFPDMPDTQRRQIVDDALHEAQRMTRLIDNMLRLADLERSGEVRKSPFDWTTLIEGMVREARECCAPRGVVVDISGDLGQGTGDVESLQEAIRALTDNVNRHTPPTATLTMTAHDEGPTVVITVSDDGPGVPPDMLERIFDPFVRVDESRHQAAAGLGLSLTAAVVAAHGGTISARAATGHGLAVEMQIPR